jgi:hypothetical protein
MAYFDDAPDVFLDPFAFAINFSTTAPGSGGGSGSGAGAGSTGSSNQSPVTPQAKPKCTVPAIRGKTLARARKKLKAAGCKYRIVGKGRVRSTSPAAGTKTAKTVLVKAKQKKKRKTKHPASG